MPYTTAANMRALYPGTLGADSTDITDAMLTGHIATFERIAERYRGVAFEPRTATETVDLCQSCYYITEHPRITAVSSITVDGAALSDSTFYEGWRIKFAYRVTGLLVVAYTHGYAEPPQEVLDACNQYVLSCALNDRSGVPRDAVSTTEGGYTIRYSTPDWDKGRPTGYLEVDRLLNSVDDERIPAVA